MTEGIELELTLGDTAINITRQIFGALSQDSRSPLSRVSISNSSFSLDAFRGCPARCAYCTVAGSERDINIVRSQSGDITGIELPSVPERLFPGSVLVDALLSHPYFIRNKSIVSIGTASTEPFHPIVGDSTWEIMERLVKSGSTNPIWIVTKMGIPDGSVSKWVDRFLTLQHAGIKVIISVSYSGAPSWVEPFQGNRFRNMDVVKASGIKISHHLRPIIPGINDTLDSIRASLNTSAGLAEVICVGGLRTDPGVELAWNYVYALDGSLLPSRKSRQKWLSSEYTESVRSYLQDIGLNDVPVVERSSEAISILLGVSDYNLYRYRTNDELAFLVIPENTRLSIQRQTGYPIERVIDMKAAEIGLGNVSAEVVADSVLLNRELAYEEHRALVHAIGHLGILP